MENKSNLPKAGLGAIVTLAKNAKKIKSIGVGSKALSLASARKKINAVGKEAKYNLPKKRNKKYSTPSHMMEETYADDKAALKHSKVVYAARYGKMSKDSAKKAASALTTSQRDKKAAAYVKKLDADRKAASNSKKRSIAGLTIAAVTGIGAKSSSPKKPTTTKTSSKPTKTK